MKVAFLIVSLISVAAVMTVGAFYNFLRREDSTREQHLLLLIVVLLWLLVLKTFP